MAQVTIIIINWNTKSLLAQCLDSINTHCQGFDIEVIVVDNGSQDGSQEMVSNRYPQVKLLQNEQNLGFAKANNLAIQASSSPYVLLLNSDALLTKGAVEAMLDLAQSQPKAGIIGARLLNVDGSFQASFTVFPSLWREFLIISGLGRLIFGRWFPSEGPQIEKGPQIVDYVEGACLFVNRDAIQEVGGLCEDYFMYAEEVDWCMRMKQRGWQVWYHPGAEVIHYGGGSSRNRMTAREGDLYVSKVLFFKKYRSRFSSIALQAMLLAFTTVKYAAHGVLRIVSRHRYGRKVIPPWVLFQRFWRG